jgi:hypothetical protein
MKNLSTAAKVYIFSTIFIGLGLMTWLLRTLDWGNLGMYILAILAAGAQIVKVEGPNDKTNYNIAWFAYGFTFIFLGAPAALFVIVIGHLAEWVWHKYPWYIQSFNIAVYAIVVFLTHLIYEAISPGSTVLNLNGVLAIAAALLVFVLSNHWLVGMVIKLARGQSFAESGVFAPLTLALDFAGLSMGAVTALIWFYNPIASILNVVPLYLLYRALRMPALLRQVESLEKVN